MDLSSGALDKIELQFDDCSRSPIFTTTISSIVNRRYTGPSSDFLLQTFIRDREIVVEETGQAQVKEPSIFTAKLSGLDQYYWGSGQPVQIDIGLIRLMETGDYFIAYLGDVYYGKAGVSCWALA